MQCSVKSTVATSSGAVNGGASRIQFLFGGTFAGTVNGVPYVGGTDTEQIITAPFPDWTLDGVPYTITAGSMRIIVLRGSGSG